MSRVDFSAAALICAKSIAIYKSCNDRLSIDTSTKIIRDGAGDWRTNSPAVSDDGDVHRQREAHSTSPENLSLTNGNNKKRCNLSGRTASARNSRNRTVDKNALKFSVENILRPDFGQRRLALASTWLHESLYSVKKPRLFSDTGDPQMTTSANADRSTPPTACRLLLSDQSPAAATAPTDLSPVTPTKPVAANGVFPAWVYCTRYSDRPSSGPRCRRIKKKNKPEEKRPRTAFTSEQLARLKKEFQENRYLTEKRRQQLSSELELNESQIKIWFQALHPVGEM